MLRSYSAREHGAKGARKKRGRTDMATKKKATASTRRGKSKTKPKPAARASAPRKAKVQHTGGKTEGVVYTSVLRELMASRLARG
jgi:hypothetical protein